MPSTPETRVATLIRQALAALASPTDSLGGLTTAIETALTRGDVQGAIDLLPWARLTEAAAPLAAALQGEIVAAGRLVAFPLLGETRFAFDDVDVMVVRYAQSQAATLISQITYAQREQVRQIITDAVSGHYAVPQAARLIQQRVGLHDRWGRAVTNGWQSTYDAAIKGGATEARATAAADRQADRIRKRLLKARATNIARTEVKTAESNGRFLGWSQAIEQGFASRDSLKSWLLAPSGSSRGAACDICTPMVGVKVRWDQPFPNGVLMPPAHPGCRCDAVLEAPTLPDEATLG